MALEARIIILMCLGACAKAENPMDGQRCNLALDTEAVHAASQFALGVEDGLSSSNDTNDTGSAVGDPHVVTSRGFKLELNQPGNYTLLQVPHDGPPLLRLEATVERSGKSCTFYITNSKFLGAWFHKDILDVRAESGENGWPFAIKMSDVGPWTSLVDVSSGSETILQTYKHADVEVTVSATRQTTKGAASKKDHEGYFSVLVGKPGQPQGERTVIKIAKGEHWLNVALNRLGNLGYSKVGGVLGTDVPNAKWTELPEDCKMFHELQGEQRRMPELGSDSDASILWY